MTYKHSWANEKRNDINHMDVADYQALQEIKEICLTYMKAGSEGLSLTKKQRVNVKLMRTLAQQLGQL